jgi:hypothetical protein
MNYQEVKKILEPMIVSPDARMRNPAMCETAQSLSW